MLCQMPSRARFHKFFIEQCALALQRQQNLVDLTLFFCRVIIFRKVDKKVCMDRVEKECPVTHDDTTINRVCDNIME